MAAPIVLPLLVAIAVMNGLICRRMEPIARYSCANWPLELFLALGAIASAVGVHLATNALGMEGFAIQALLLLLGGVAPALGFFTAFASLRLVERVASVPGLSAALGSCAMIAVLSFL